MFAQEKVRGPVALGHFDLGLEEYVVYLCGWYLGVSGEHQGWEYVAFRLRTLVQADYGNVNMPANTLGCLWPKKESKQAKVNGSEQSWADWEPAGYFRGLSLCMLTSKSSGACATTGMKIDANPDV